MSVSEHAVSACEFAGGGGNKRRNEDRKLSVSVLDVFYCPLHDTRSKTLEATLKKNPINSPEKVIEDPEEYRPRKSEDSYRNRQCSERVEHSLTDRKSVV